MDELKDRELKLWEAYKYKGDTAAAKELYESMTPLIQGYTRKWTRKGVPDVAISSFGRQLFLRALDDYDPTKGAALGTHVRNHLGWRMNRFVNTYKNVARVNEKKDRMITSFKNAFEYLEVKLGREPSVLELTEELQIPESQVRDLLKSVRKELSASGLEASGLKWSQTRSGTRITQCFILRGFRRRAAGLVSFGWKGRPKLNAEIAARTDVSTKISHIKKRLADVLKDTEGCCRWITGANGSKNYQQHENLKYLKQLEATYIVKTGQTEKFKALLLNAVGLPKTYWRIFWGFHFV